MLKKIYWWYRENWYTGEENNYLCDLWNRETSVPNKNWKFIWSCWVDIKR